MRSIFGNSVKLVIGLSCFLISNPRSHVAGQVQANFQLRNSALNLHEPVVLVFRAHNVSMTEVMLNLGVAKTEFFRFAVTTPQGATLRNAAPYTEGFHPSGKVVLAAGGDYEQELILNEWFQFNSTGTYALKARLDTSADVSGTGNVQLEPTDIPFEIKERSPERLTKICSDLAEKVKLAPNAQAAQEPAILLSYVDDPIAIPYLAQLLDAHKLVESAAVSGLERIGNEQSVKILVSALNSEYGETSDLARETLGRILRKSSDPRVKETIRNAGIK